MIAGIVIAFHQLFPYTNIKIHLILYLSMKNDSKSSRFILFS
ncbi:hypothetical protein DAT561_0507 [Melissococcus plutonius]|uniref:Uncharacterized protein n=1 Tax=Melissococcus plutonius TaxID=33970 RepID=A0A2Z5Y1G6_9ENTE|nr:hypothetical protein DAT561_0507 [Melissococcus plutonius]